MKRKHMDFSHKLIIGLCLATLAVALGLWYVSVQPVSDGKMPMPSSPPPQKFQLPPGPRILINYIGKEIKTDPGKEKRAEELLLQVAARFPDMYGKLNKETSNDNIRRSLQDTAAGLANYSMFDYACESMVTTEKPCSTIEKDYKDSREGFPEHFVMYPPSEEDNCDMLRSYIGSIGPVTSATCTQESGQRKRLCNAIVSRDCKTTYRIMIEDYTYTEMGLTTGERGFCELVEDSALRTGCSSSDKNVVRNEIVAGYD